MCLWCRDRSAVPLRGRNREASVSSVLIASKGAVVAAITSAAVLLSSYPAESESPARERQLTCSDGTTFTGEQVRHGRGRPPSAWRVVDPGSGSPAFVFRAVTLTAPDGTVDEAESWDNTSGVRRHHELITCGFVIPVGPLTGYQADFVGFFVPPRG